MASQVGRPSLYTPEIADKLDEYLATTGREQTSLPTVEGFAIFLGVGRRTIYDWAKQHKEFSHTLERLMTIQGKQLIDDGIYGGKEVNATIVKLLLQNNHGMVDRSDPTTLNQYNVEKIEVIPFRSLPEKPDVV